MKVTLVSMQPTEEAKSKGRPALTPELLAATGARYSRSNDGLEAILSKIDPNNLSKSVDSIFRMVDYGHQSIADMVPVAMFIDEISIFLAYKIWSLCPTAGGQESSTRYIKMSADDVISPEVLGIEPTRRAEWTDYIEQSFNSYQSALTLWEEAIQKHPELIGLSTDVLNDTSDAGQKRLARLKRNYGFDRARYFLPVAAATNVMLSMSARGWVQLCQHLLSSPLSEAIQVGEGIRNELELVAPRLMKHAALKVDSQAGQQEELESYVRMAADASAFGIRNLNNPAREVEPRLQLFPPAEIHPNDGSYGNDLAHHTNRYAWIGTGMQRTGVRFGWGAVSFAEIRDLNRHRTGSKYCPLVPRGFYFADEQIDKLPNHQAETRKQLREIAESAATFIARSVDSLRSSDPTYIYWTNLGTQYLFEHLTTVDKFVYEAELRTGVGSHFRYASHLREVLSIFYKLCPNTKGKLLEGSAEPE
jgi:thymidylate synthase ThyX